ncbi:MAG: hypothetical protein V1702_06285 [Candidatus Woesearchaeota archaeon]
MPDIKIPELEVIYRGMFVMQPLYRVIRKWLIENEFYANTSDGKGDPSMESSMEQLYLERRGTAHKATEREWRIWWRTEKPVDRQGKSRYYKYHLDINFNVIQGVDMEVMREGKKEIVQFGELRLMIEPYIELQEMSKHPLIGYIDYFFRTRIIKKNLEEHRKMLYQDSYRLQSMIKKYLEMMSYMPEEETFHKKFEFI